MPVTYPFYILEKFLIRPHVSTYIIENILVYVNTYVWYSLNKNDWRIPMSKVKFTTTIDSVLLQEIKIQAIKENRSVSDILEELLKDYLSKVNISEKD